MNGLDKKILNLIQKNNNFLIPQKVKNGIQLGNVLIKSLNSKKDIIQHNRILYEGIHLNNVAILIAKYCALKEHSSTPTQLYFLDQEYGHWLFETNMFGRKYKESVKIKQYDQAEIYEARYTEAKIRLDLAKHKVDNLVMSTINKL